MQTRKIVFTAPRQAAVVDNELPEPQAGQVLVRMTVSLISTGTECYCYRGEFGEGTNWASWVKYPFEPGYSAVGVVEQVAPADDVPVVDATGTPIQIGDRVFSCTGHCERWVVPGESVIKLPADITDEQGTLGTLATITQTAVRRAQHTMGNTVAIVGLGPIGQLALQYVRITGAREVLAIDTVAVRLERATEHGATATFCGSAADAKPFVLEHTENELADVVYDATGHWSVLPLALPLARDYGKVVLLGDTPFPERQHLTGDVLIRQVDVIGTHNVKLPPAQAWWTRWRQIQLFHTFVQRGQIRVDDLITDRCAPADAPNLYERLLEQRDQTGYVIFDWVSRHPAATSRATAAHGQ